MDGGKRLANFADGKCKWIGAEMNKIQWVWRWGTTVKLLGVSTGFRVPSDGQPVMIDAKGAGAGKQVEIGRNGKDESRLDRKGQILERVRVQSIVGGCSTGTIRRAKIDRKLPREATGWEWLVVRARENGWRENMVGVEPQGETRKRSWPESERGG